MTASRPVLFNLTQKIVWRSIDCENRLPVLDVCFPSLGHDRPAHKRLEGRYTTQLEQDNHQVLSRLVTSRRLGMREMENLDCNEGLRLHRPHLLEGTATGLSTEYHPHLSINDIQIVPVSRSRHVSGLHL